MSIEAECLRKGRAWNQQNCFLKSIYPLVRLMISEGEKECRIADIFLNLFNKHKGILTMLQTLGNNLNLIVNSNNNNNI